MHKQNTRQRDSKMLKALLEQQLYEKLGTDMKTISLLPNDVMVSIRSNIRKGAEDLQQNWANALELVHKAYEVEGVQRPDPSLKDAWKQYEENLQYAVQQLSTNRGSDGDWRMSASMFREALVPKQQFNVEIGGDQFVVEGKDVLDVITTLTERVGEYETKVTKKGAGYQLSFTKHHIRNNTKVRIEPAA